MNQPHLVERRDEAGNEGEGPDEEDTKNDKDPPTSVQRLALAAADLDRQGEEERGMEGYGMEGYGKARGKGIGGQGSG